MKVLFSLLNTINLIQFTLATGFYEPKPNTLFDICYINLEQDIDRNKRMESMLRYAKCNFNRFNAVDGINVLTNHKQLKESFPGAIEEPKIQINKYNVNIKSRMPMIGKKISAEILFHFVAHNTYYTIPMLVLQDNIDLDCNFVRKIETALQDLPKDWDMLLINDGYKVAKINTVESTKICAVGSFTQCRGYLINGPHTGKKVYNLILNKCVRDISIIKFLSDEIKNNHIKVFAMKVPLAVKLPSVSYTREAASNKRTIPIENSLYNLLYNNNLN